MKPTAFLITIDTEGDNLWKDATQITTKNAQFLPRFQALCEKYGFKPCYLTNYEMATDPVYQAFAQDVIRRNAGEIGMHLHAWNSPPIHDLTGGKDAFYKPYLIEYPEQVMREKIHYMTALLEDTFSLKIHSHRAGRWAFNSTYAKILREEGYVVDCSVTPHIDWSGTRGSPDGNGGTNYRNFPTHAYFLDENDISRPGNSHLLEIPMTIQPKDADNWLEQLKKRVRALRGRYKHQWLRPRQGNLEEMQRVCHNAQEHGQDYLEFMLHSSEFMPAGSPTFPNEATIERLFEDLEILFSELSEYCFGCTPSEYHDRFVAAQAEKTDTKTNLPG
ncbi:MAG TPA: hypothetical protein VJ642_03470 [Chromobacteriaceae bacterium]|nr:hypothetical protein [Chromobacteriaceae bacterium]